MKKFWDYDTGACRQAAEESVGQVLYRWNQYFNMAFLPYRCDKVLWIRPFQNRQKVASSEIKIELCWQIGEHEKWNDNDSEFLTTTNNAVWLKK